MDILPSVGQRAIIIGQTGSGKTQGAIWLLQHMPIAPCIILDTKGEPAFDDIAQDDERVVFFNSAESFVKQWKKDVNAEWIIVRPTPAEMAEPLEMDDTLAAIYDKARPCLVYIDEAYQWHVNGKAGAGLNGLLTRGRSKKITTILSTQRPAWVSRFCFTECQRFFIFRVQDKRDRKTIAEYIPEFDEKSIADKFHFWYYDYELDNGAVLFSPVPMQDKRHKGVNPPRFNWV